MTEPGFEDTRKSKQSIRRKSRKSTSSRRQSRRQSKRRQTGGVKSLKGQKSTKESSTTASTTWDEDELGFGDVMANLQGEPLGESPIDLELAVLKKATILPILQWLNTENLPHAMKITNSGYTATVCGLWAPGECPKLRGGPLKEDYDFSQFHFHWGEHENDGSEHLIEHKHYPLEVHVVFHKSSYKIHERARKEHDGLIVVVYFYTLSRRPNMNLESIIPCLNDISSPLTEKYIDPFTYTSVFPIFTEDYILYNGWMKHKCLHATLWFICRETLGINADQLEKFRKIVGFEGTPILKNYRDVKETGDMRVFIVYPSSVDTGVVLHPRPMTPEDPKSEEKITTAKYGKSTNDKHSKSSVRRQSKRQSRRQSKRQSKASSKRQSMKRKSKAGGSRKSMK